MQRTSHRWTPARSAIALAVLAAACLPVRAQTAQFDIPAQPLPEALAHFAQQSGLQIVFNPELGAGRASRPVSGMHDAAAALAQLLRGTGLQARRDGATWVLERAPSDGAATLAPVTVTAAAEADGTTEGTGSYGARQAGVAVPLPLSLRETPQSVSVIGRQQIEDQNLLTLSDVLLQTPGIVLNKRDERVDLSSRGFGLGTLQDGVPTLAYSSPAGEAGAASTTIYDRVEVVRGAAGLLSGAGTPGGAINLVRKRPPKEAAGSVGAGWGTWGRHQIEGDWGGSLNAAQTLRGRLAVSHAAGDSFIHHRGRSEDVAYGVVEADIAPETLLSAGIESQRTGLDGASFCTNPPFAKDGTPLALARSFNCSTPWTYWNIYSQRVWLNLDQGLVNGWRLRVNAARATNRRAIDTGSLWADPPSVDPSGDAVFALTRVRTEGTDKSLDVHASGPFELFGRTHRAALGFNHGRYAYQDRGYMAAGNAAFADRLVPGSIYDTGAIAKPDLSQLYAILGGETQQSGLYGSAQFKPADRLSLLVGGRLSWYRNDSWYRYWILGMNGEKNSTLSRETAVFTPYVGVVFDLGAGYSAYASYTDIFEPNTARDRDGRVLQPKVGRNYEAGLKGEHAGGRLNTSVSVFQTEQDNVPMADGVQADGSTAYRPARGTRTRGFELTAAGELAPGLQLLGGYTYSTPRTSDGAALYPQYPQRLLRATVGYRLPAPLNRWTVGGSLNHQSATRREQSYGMGAMSQGALTLLGVMARYQVNPQLSVSLNVENLTDKVYYAGYLGSGYQYGAPRNAWLKLNYRF